MFIIALALAANAKFNGPVVLPPQIQMETIGNAPEFNPLQINNILVIDAIELRQQVTCAFLNQVFASKNVKIILANKCSMAATIVSECIERNEIIDLIVTDLWLRDGSGIIAFKKLSRLFQVKNITEPFGLILTTSEGEEILKANSDHFRQMTTITRPLQLSNLKATLFHLMHGYKYTSPPSLYHSSNRNLK
eukprot:TRINITY_DN17853_c0_g3_i2.p1 TRINITY_DN17853_c0_g3~~TRINITY_DN17853_c0_g3_i2.p1  ORF type:complete len:192 (-),score=33.04 TRINITY_DN17853_c0_g3_i2:65-640(-)